MQDANKMMSFFNLYKLAEATSGLDKNQVTRTRQGNHCPLKLNRITETISRCSAPSRINVNYSQNDRLSQKAPSDLPKLPHSLSTQI